MHSRMSNTSQTHQIWYQWILHDVLSEKKWAGNDESEHWMKRTPKKEIELTLFFVIFCCLFFVTASSLRVSQMNSKWIVLDRHTLCASWTALAGWKSPVSFQIIALTWKWPKNHSNCDHVNVQHQTKVQWVLWWLILITSSRLVRLTQWKLNEMKRCHWGAMRKTIILLVKVFNEESPQMKCSISISSVFFNK